jgi:single-strand DNA-binding protein
MLQLSLAGRAGRDAEYKQTQGGSELCSFTVAADVGFGENKQTVWVDVTRWGKGAQGLAGCIRKGDPVAVTGEMSTREHDGKTYIQCRADRVTLLGSKRENANGGETTQRFGQQPVDSFADDLDDSVPF